MEIVDLALTQDLEALQAFYADLIIPGFPVLDELDDLDDWIEALDPAHRAAAHELEPELYILLAIDTSTREQLGGAVYERYPGPNCGLLSYLVVGPLHRGRGVARALVLKSCAELRRQHVQVYFAETHKLGVSDGVMDEGARHIALHRLGFRPLRFRYQQPPLSASKHASGGLLLLVHADLLTPWPHCSGASAAFVVQCSVIRGFIDGFAGSVMGFDHREDYERAPYFAAMLAQLREDSVVEILHSMPPPWVDVEPSQRRAVAVVGGGVAGLSAVTYLLDAGVERVLLLEANTQLGGRVMQLDGFAPWGPLDLGAEFVHGSSVAHSSVASLAQQEDWAMSGLFDIAMWGKYCGRASTVNTGRALLWLGEDEGRSVLAPLCCDDPHPVLAEARSAYDAAVKVALCDSSNEGVSLLEACKRQNASAAAVGVVDCIVAQTEAADPASCGILPLARADELWEYGDDNLRIDGSYALLLDWLKRRTKDAEVRLGWEATAITQEHDEQECRCVRGHFRRRGVRIESSTGDSVEVDAAVVAVPPTQLRRKRQQNARCGEHGDGGSACVGGLRFTPPLPDDTLRSLLRINMRSAVKAVALFSRAFWPVETTIVFCPRGAGTADRWPAFSQVWFDTGGRHGDHQEAVATGFATAGWADELQALTEEEIAALLLRQLDAMFGGRGVASATVLNTAVYDWSKHPFVCGGYSSPCVGEDEEERSARRRAHGKVHFAGEHTNVGTGATVQAAIESGRRAAREVIMNHTSI